MDWFAWGEEAFAKARAEDKPIFLSVGYSTCHWCHVMARESFEDSSIARQLAEGFIAIKVDREELPDVDSVYMQALQILTGRGGWPMNLFLTPQLAPFFGGTYFPPRSRPGLVGFPELLVAVRDGWVQRRGDVEMQSQALLMRMRGSATSAPRATADGVQQDALAQITERFDPVNGGFGRAPKFPRAPLLQYLLGLATTGEERARAMLQVTLRQMAAGGIYDHVGGGFARYSIDERWHVPHFEKMLYDNAQLARVYASAYRLTGDRRLRFAAEDTLNYLMREMRPATALAALSSAQDADAEGVEGKFQVWTLQDFYNVLGVDAPAAAHLYGVTADGNWEQGRNVLERREALTVLADLGLGTQASADWERSVRNRLYAARAARVWPITDDKVLADWNGMALRAFAFAGRVLQRADLVEAARNLGNFLLANLTRNGRAHHAWRNSVLRDEGYLADHAQLGLGCVELHAATGEPQWLVAAFDLCGQMLERFHVAGVGLFDADAGPLPTRACEVQDAAVPSGTGAACELLLRLAGVFDRPDWHDVATATLDRHAALLADTPIAVPTLLFARLLVERGRVLAVPAGPAGAGLWAEAQLAFAPLVTLVSGAAESIPVLVSRRAGEAYLCRQGSCELPARSIAELRLQLESINPWDPAEPGFGFAPASSGAI